MRGSDSYHTSRDSSRTGEQEPAGHRSDVLTSWRQQLLTIIVAAAVSWLILPSGGNGGDGKIDMRIKSKIQTISDALNECQQNVQMAKDECQKRPALTNIENDISKLKKETGVFTSSIRSIEEQQEQLEGKLLRQVSDTENKLRELDNSETTIKQNMESVNDQQVGVEERIKQFLSPREEELRSGFNKKTAETEKDISQLTREASATSEKCEKMKESLEQETKKAKESAEEIREAKDELEKQIHEMEEVVQLLRRNVLHKGTLLTILLFLLAAIVVLVLVIFVICQRLPPATSTR